MTSTMLVALGLAAGALVSVLAARRVAVAYPLLVVLFGAAASFVPSITPLRVSPHLVYFGLLPPLVYYAAFISSPRALRADAGLISLLAVGLVLATMFGVAALAHTVIGNLGWTTALVLGAVVAPTDPVAALTVLEEVGAPRRVRVILEGESLLNDGIAFTLFSVAVSAATGAHITAVDGVRSFVTGVAGASAIGLAVGWLAHAVRRRIGDADVEIALSLLTAYVAFTLAEAIGVSGVLATVVTGLYLSLRTAGTLRPQVRLQGRSFWEIVDFSLNSILFLLLGLEFRGVVRGVSRSPVGPLLAGTAGIVLGGIALRMLWQFVVPGAFRVLRVDRVVPLGEPLPWQHRLLVGWGGLRGATSLAAALSIPFATSAGTLLPGRPEVLFVAFVFIYVTLLVQGASLGAFSRRLQVTGEEGSPEEWLARQRLAQCALDRLDDASPDDLPADAIAALRDRFTRELDLIGRTLDTDGDGERTDPTAAYNALATEIIGAQRRCLHELRRQRKITTQTFRRLRHELDLDELRLG